MENVEKSLEKLEIEEKSSHVLIIEPFYGGSHKVLIDTLLKTITKYTLITLPAKKWHWRARCSALLLYKQIPPISTENILFCSSVLSLAELLGIRKDLQPLKKVVYFHENQLIYPVQEIKERDIQYGYNQIMTCLAADVVLFNSQFNKQSFLQNINKMIKLLPDNRPKNIQDEIIKKSQVIYFPVQFPINIKSIKSESLLHIVWPHRWEFDKGPDEFYDILVKLKTNNLKFHVSILGETFSEIPQTLNSMKNEFKNEIVNFGFVESKEEYFNILSSCHVVISTALHEFFGVSVLEATFCGCFPLVPARLVYPEIYPEQCLYKDLSSLYESLKEFCLSPNLAINARQKLDIKFENYSETNLLPLYENVLKV